MLTVRGYLPRRTSFSNSITSQRPLLQERSLLCFGLSTPLQKCRHCHFAVRTFLLTMTTRHLVQSNVHFHDGTGSDDSFSFPRFGSFDEEFLFTPSPPKSLALNLLWKTTTQSPQTFDYDMQFAPLLPDLLNDVGDDIETTSNKKTHLPFRPRFSALTRDMLPPMTELFPSSSSGVLPTNNTVWSKSVDNSQEDDMIASLMSSLCQIHQRGASFSASSCLSHGPFPSLGAARHVRHTSLGAGAA